MVFEYHLVLASKAQRSIVRSEVVATTMQRVADTSYRPDRNRGRDGAQQRGSAQSSRSSRCVQGSSRPAKDAGQEATGLCGSRGLAVPWRLRIAQDRAGGLSSAGGNCTGSHRGIAERVEIAQLLIVSVPSFLS